MKNAFLIIAHGDYELLKRLVEALDYCDNEMFIHIDAKSKPLNKSDLCSNILYSKVYIFQEYDVRWGDQTQVLCETFLIKKALEKGTHDYYHIISGVDYPAKSNKEINAFFEKNRGKEFVSFDSEKVSPQALDRVRYYHPFCRCYKLTKSKMIHKAFFIADNISVKLQKIFGKEKMLPFKTIQKGCNWCSITEQLAQYVVAHEKDIKKLVYKSKAADEIFIQTLVINSEFKNNLYHPTFDDDYTSCARYIKWDNQKSPRLLTEKDYDDIIASEAVFARKLSSDTSKKLIEKLSERN